MKINYNIKEFDEIPWRPGDYVQVISVTGIYDHPGGKQAIGRIFRLPERNTGGYINFDEFYSTGKTECTEIGGPYSINHYRHDLRKLTKKEIEEYVKNKL